MLRKEPMRSRPSANASRNTVADGSVRRARYSWKTKVLSGEHRNRDEIESKAETLKGKVKQVAGDLTNNSDLHDEGVVDEAAGHARDAIGRGRRTVGEAIEHIGNAIKK